MWLRSANGEANRPSANFASRISVTASSMRLIGMFPAWTSDRSVSMNSV